MSSNLPPLRNLPSWSRVRDLDRVRYPRLLTSDYMVRSPPVGIRSVKAAAADPRTDAQEDTRVASLQKDIEFLLQQHKDTLERLHAEIDGLKRLNKGSIGTNSDSSKSSRDGSAERVSQCRFISSAESGQGAVTSLLPLQISCSSSQNPRNPTLKECELIIRELYQANSSQHQELLRVKTLLRNIASTNKASAEVSLTRACQCDNNRAEVFKHFPKLPLKPLPTKQLPSQVSKGATVILPAIKRNLSSSTMSERQRRAQDGHRMRLRRTVNS
ncbi:uncharacterized protein isoform X4 [Danio rerio]